MIRRLDSLDRAGAAVCIHLAPPAGAAWLRVLRRMDDAFPADPADADGATAVIYDGRPASPVLDWRGVRVGSAQHYAPYYRIADTWAMGTPGMLIPGYQTHPPRLDSLDILRERVEAGLNCMVLAGLVPHPRGHFAVLTAPPLTEDIVFPAVAVQLHGCQPDPGQQYVNSGFLGAEALGDAWERVYFGGLSRYQTEVGAWSLNPDERRLLRRALRDVLWANRVLLEALGIQELEIGFTDSEDFQSFAAPLYRTTANLTYLAPDVIQLDAQAPRFVAVDLTVDNRGSGPNEILHVISAVPLS